MAHSPASWVLLGLVAAVSSCAEATPEGARSASPAGRTGAATERAIAPRAASPARDARASAGAPPIDRDFVRRLALTKSFQLGQPVSATPTPDGKAIVFLRSTARDKAQSLFEMDLATGATRELVAPAAVARGPETLSPAERARRERMRVTASGFTSFELSRDGARVLVTLSGRLYVVTRATLAAKELPTGAGPAIDPRFSPDGKRVAYVRDGDVYAVASDGAGREAAVTRGGAASRTHGAAEFVAEEELGRHHGFWWSPDGARVLYEEADTSKVESLTIADASRPEREPDRIAYPRPGHANADVRLGITRGDGASGTTWVAWDRAAFPYVATVTWEKDGPLAIYVLDRAQENGELLAIDPKTGASRRLVAEHDASWIDVDRSVPRFLPDGRFFWSSDRSGAAALELRSAGGEAATTLVASGYRELADVDPGRGLAHVVTGDDPATSRLVTVRAPAAGSSTAATASDVAFEVPDGVVAPRFGDGHDVFVARVASRTSLQRFTARSVDGKTERPVPSVAEDPGAVPGVELATVGPDGVRVAIVRPRAFEKGRSYPVIDAAYGGPGHGVAIASASQYLREQWLADAAGAIVVALDARGTPHRGRAWERALDGKMGQVPLDGHVAALAALGRAYPEMDMARVGIFGWSFGGYLSALAALDRPDVFKAAVAGAPVVDWRDYDTCYTERYLGLPDAQKAAYDAASLLTHVAAKPGVAPAPLLVIHGTADDNVYFAHTLKLVDAMERAGRPFELMPLVGVTHQPYDPSLAEALWVRTATFLRDHLRG